MTVRVVRLGSDRSPGEGLRIGTVRHPPRGVPKNRHATGNWYDVWLPNLAPSADSVKRALRATTDREWAAFAKRYRADEARCHRSGLRALLVERGARIASAPQGSDGRAA